MPHTREELLSALMNTTDQRDNLLAAARLTVLHFKRNQLGDHFQGDDEHEAWTALVKAIARAEAQ